MKLAKTIGVGLAAGVAGTAVMTLSEKIEQAITGRPSSYVPAHTGEKLLRLRHKPDRERFLLNQAFHWGFGIVGGVMRAAMAARGLRGPFASYLFSGVRLSIDQTLENATGVGAPPWTWPTGEQVIDILHKGVYAVATGLFVDRMIGAAA